jgi:integrase
LIAHKGATTAPESELTDWAAELSERQAEALERHGITTRRRREEKTLGGFLDAYMLSRTDVKPPTAYQLNTVINHLVACFGADKLLNSFKVSDGRRLRLYLLTECGLGENTTRRRLGRARQFFNEAVAQELVTLNPFDGLKVQVQANPERFHYVTREDTGRLSDAAPDAQWRLIIALCRYGGLRCPSEVLSLQWGHVNWELGRVTVPSPKTAHHAGGASRVIPLFPELRPYLEDALELSDGSEHCITRYRDRNSNLRTQLGRIATKAGVDLWQKPFQNMRSTRETELANDYPQHVVCRWLGNSELVAAKHYLQLTDEHFEKATGEVSGAPLKAPLDTPLRGTLASQSDSADEPQTPVFTVKNDSVAFGDTCQELPSKDSNLD